MPVQKSDNITFSDVDSSTKLKAKKKLPGMDNKTRQATANKQVEMFFRLTCKVDTSGDVVLSRRIFLEILNNL